MAAMRSPLYVFLFWLMMGFCLVDFAFDYPLLEDSPSDAVITRAQSYYGRTRETFFPVLILTLLPAIFASLIYSFFTPGGCVNRLCLLLSLAVTPYYLFYMGPAEDAMAEQRLSPEEALPLLRLVAWGHVLLISLGAICVSLHLYFGNPVPKQCPVAHAKSH